MFLFPCTSIKDEVQIVCVHIRDSAFFLIANMNINLALFFVGVVLCRTELFSILHVVSYLGLCGRISVHSGCYNKNTVN